MDVLLKRMAALLVGRLVAMLGRWGAGHLPAEQTSALEGWVAHTLATLLNLGVSGLWSRLRPPGNAREGSGNPNL